MVQESPPPLPTFDPQNAQTYTATCHCGTVQYSVTLSPPLPQQKVVECNCSICSRNGYLLVYPSREHLVFSRGEETLKSYSFGKNQNLHKFCVTCGSSVFLDPRMREFGDESGLDLIGINVRMIQGFKLEELDIVKWDGWNKSKFIDSEHLR